MGTQYRPQKVQQPLFLQFLVIDNLILMTPWKLYFIRFNTDYQIKIAIQHNGYFGSFFIIDCTLEFSNFRSFA